MCIFFLVFGANIIVTHFTIKKQYIATFGIVYKSDKNSIYANICPNTEIIVHFLKFPVESAQRFQSAQNVVKSILVEIGFCKHLVSTFPSDHNSRL